MSSVTISTTGPPSAAVSHPDHRLARGAVLRQRQVGPRGDLQLAPVAAQRTERSGAWRA